MSWSGFALATIVALGFISDIFDGVVARRSNAATAGLRRFDSITDTFFYVSCAVAALLTRGALLGQHKILISLIVATQIVGYLLEVRRFGRAASYHSWSGKVWGAMLPFGLIQLFAWSDDGILVLALICGLISQVEGFFITQILPEWRHDVPSVVHAAKIRAEWKKAVATSDVISTA